MKEPAQDLPPPEVPNPSPSSASNTPEPQSRAYPFFGIVLGGCCFLVAISPVCYYSEPIVETLKGWKKNFNETSLQVRLAFGATCVVVFLCLIKGKDLLNYWNTLSVNTKSIRREKSPSSLNSGGYPCDENASEVESQSFLTLGNALAFFGPLLFFASIVLLQHNQMFFAANSLLFVVTSLVWYYF